MKMKNEFILRNFLLFFCLIYLHFLHIVVVDCQRSGIGHRLDVYIAGFFPYKEGAEKSETGMYTTKMGLLLSVFNERAKENDNDANSLLFT